MKTKRKIGEKVRLLRSRHPAMRSDLVNKVYGGREGVVVEIEHFRVSIKIDTLVLSCDPRSLRGAAS